MEVPLPATKDIRKDAKVLKQFCVLVKRKLQREQLCRSLNFRKLMALVFDPDEKDRSLSCTMFSKQTLFGEAP